MLVFKSRPCCRKNPIIFLKNKSFSYLRLKPTSQSYQLNIHLVPISTLQQHVPEFLGFAGPLSGDPPSPLDYCINPEFRCGRVANGCIGGHSGGLYHRNKAGKFGKLLGFLLLLLFIFLLLSFHGSCYLPFGFLFPGFLSAM